MTTEERLARLERFNRLLLLALLVLAGAFTIAATNENIPDVVKARAFHVVGKDGTPLVKLEDGGGIAELAGRGTIATYNGNGRPLFVVLSESGPDGFVGTVSTLNGNGQHLVDLGVTEGGVGNVKTLNGKGQKLVELGSRKDGPGVVLTYDPRSIEARGVYTTR